MNTINYNVQLESGKDVGLVVSYSTYKSSFKHDWHGGGEEDQTEVEIESIEYDEELNVEEAEEAKKKIDIYMEDIIYKIQSEL